jgi:Icc-related predicted phosphoesterase
MKNLINELKENNQDFEFYPTTKEIIEKIYYDLSADIYREQNFSCLDIGSGNGNFFNKFNGVGDKAKITDKFAIEKSEILISEMASDIIIVGVDFWQNTLIDKKVNFIFCNPPYSEFESWSEKIIKEGNAKTIYLVIPERWKNSGGIKEALKLRKAEATSIGSFDFLDAERQARAKVEIVKINLQKGYDYGVDPFDLFIEQNFNFSAMEVTSWEARQAERKAKKEEQEKIKGNELAMGKDLVQILVSFYNQDMQNLLETYKKLETLDCDLLKELGVEVRNIKRAINEKIGGLKSKYWSELFNNLDKITSRLIYSQTEHLLRKMNNNVNIDFNESNAYALVIWVIKNANKYYDDQLKEIFFELSEPAYIKNYKSNQKTWEKDGWRYTKNHTNYTLDYRVIVEKHSDKYQDKFVNDVWVIANNLGFKRIGDVKKFKNGNVHFRFEKDFIQALNIEASRLLGWIKSPQEAEAEFHETCEFNKEEAKKYFNKNFSLPLLPKALLLN